MKQIDQPFRPQLDFYVVWFLLAIPTLWLTHPMEKDQGWLSYTALVIVASLFSTLVLYGPVLLARQVIHSGTRGWFVLRVLFSTLLGATLFCAILFFTGHAGGVMYTGLLSCSATTYLHWKLRNGQQD